jgi:hypothetical protein
MWRQAIVAPCNTKERKLNERHVVVKSGDEIIHDLPLEKFLKLPYAELTDALTLALKDFPAKLTDYCKTNDVSITFTDRLRARFKTQDILKRQTLRNLISWHNRMDFSKRASCTAKDNARIALDGQSVHDSFMSEDEIEEIRESLKSTRGSSTRGGKNWSANLTKYEHRRSHITIPALHQDSSCLIRTSRRNPSD